MKKVMTKNWFINLFVFNKVHIIFNVNSINRTLLEKVIRCFFYDFHFGKKKENGHIKKVLMDPFSKKKFFGLRFLKYRFDIVFLLFLFICFLRYLYFTTTLISMVSLLKINYFVHRNGFFLFILWVGPVEVKGVIIYFSKIIYLILYINDSRTTKCIVD